jgi:hypothetical protein
MLNHIETYQECGKRCAIARNQYDEARAQFEHDWLNKALRLESYQDRITARNAFNMAYQALRDI